MPNRGTVVITGASSGIGEACAIYLAQNGFQVFAGVRKEADGSALQQKVTTNLQPLMLDVTNSEQITEAAHFVSEEVGNAGLAGLVNNAGIAVAGPVEFVPIDDLRWQLEVNVVGQVAVTQAFMSLLRTAKGRIVNMGSIGGRSSTPFFGPYSASKFGLEAITDSLRLEVAPWGMHASIIEPGAVKTPIWEKGEADAKKMVEKFPPEADDLYGKTMQRMMQITRSLDQAGIPPIEVAKAVFHALTAENPKNRYVVGRDARQRVWLERLPDWLRDRLIARVFGLELS